MCFLVSSCPGSFLAVLMCGCTLKQLKQLFQLCITQTFLDYNCQKLSPLTGLAEVSGTCRPRFLGLPKVGNHWCKTSGDLQPAYRVTGVTVIVAAFATGNDRPGILCSHLACLCCDAQRYVLGHSDNTFRLALHTLA